MFQRINQDGETILFSFNGKTLQAQEGDTLAAALLSCNERVFRNAQYADRARGPYCMMGSCYECLVVLDGETIQACQILVTDGMAVRSLEALGEGT